jgi:hypothetical protein
MSTAAEIAQFFELFKAGAITEAEFNAAKAKLLGNTTPQNSGTRGFAAVEKPLASKAEQPANKSKSSSNPSPLQSGAAVAAGVIGGRLISDRLLDDPSTDPTAFATETITFPDGDVISGAAVEMPNGDVFYSITEDTGIDVTTYSGSMTAEEVNDFTNSGDTSDSGSDFSSQDADVDTGGFDGFDFF